MNDTFRYILAGVLIFLIIILQPIYLDWLGYDGVDIDSIDDEIIIAFSYDRFTILED